MKNLYIKKLVSLFLNSLDTIALRKFSFSIVIPGVDISQKEYSSFSQIGMAKNLNNLRFYIASCKETML